MKKRVKHACSLMRGRWMRRRRRERGWVKMWGGTAGYLIHLLMIEPFLTNIKNTSSSTRCCASI
jgi:hypothetical protein